MYNNTTVRISQDDVLKDIDGSGKERPWALHKAEAMVLAQGYKWAMKGAKGARVQNCADSLQFEIDQSGALRLAAAKFCRVRLCPICQWRRSLKTFSQVQQVVSYLAARRTAAHHKPYEYIMLTVTVPNVDGIDLSNELDLIHRGWQRIMQRKNVARIAKGWVRATEVTYNAAADTWHPHIHAVIAVNPSYFNDPRVYISQPEWLEYWRDAMRCPSITQVDIRRTYGNPEKACAEISKYACKPSDYVDASDLDKMAYLLDTLDETLTHRRFLAWGGAMKEAHKVLELDDAENGDLIHIGDDLNAADAAGNLAEWTWAPGPHLYIRIHTKEYQNTPIWAFWAHFFANKGGFYAIRRYAARCPTLRYGYHQAHRFRPHRKGTR